MLGQTTFITKEGLELSKTELQELKTVRRREVAKRIERAKELGDLSENAEYSAAKEEQAFLEGRIAELENIVNNAEVITHDHPTEEVEVGASVSVKMNGEERVFMIVGSQEADPVAGRISNESPLGKAFLGKRVGDNVEVTVPKGTLSYTILSIT